MRSKHTLLMIMGLASMMTGPSMPMMHDDRETSRPGSDTIATRRKNNLKKKGVQDFIIDGITVQARDEKNAIRKVNNIKKAHKADR